jgi:hypothetical protein
VGEILSPFHSRRWNKFSFLWRIRHFHGHVSLFTHLKYELVLPCRLVVEVQVHHMGK